MEKYYYITNNKNINSVMQLHTDNCYYIEDFDKKKHKIIDEREMDIDELNSTIYANNSEYATEPEHIILIEEIEEIE